MALRHAARTALGSALAIGLYMAVANAAVPAPQGPLGPLALGTSRVTIAGTSNIHEYTASTTAVQVTRVRLSGDAAGPNFWNELVKPRVLEAFEISISAASLSSPKQDIDKNMHKALKTAEHASITFRLLRLEAGPGTTGALRGIGVLQIAGVERQVTLSITTERKDATLAVHGVTQFLMTDFDITPPTAMLGMLKTDPKVTVTVDTVLTVPLT